MQILSFAVSKATMDMLDFERETKLTYSSAWGIRNRLFNMNHKYPQHRKKKLCSKIRTHDVSIQVQGDGRIYHLHQ